MCPHCDDELIGMVLDKAWQDGTVRALLHQLRARVYSEGYVDGRDSGTDEAVKAEVPYAELARCRV